METIENFEPTISCQHCHGTINPDDIFCGHCGKELKDKQSEKQEDVFSSLMPALLYYFITLLFLVTYKFTTLFPSGFEGMLSITIIDILIVIAFWIHNAKQIAPLLSPSRVNLKILTLTIMGAGFGSVIVSYIAHVINLSIQDDVFYSTYLFEDTEKPFLMGTLFIAVQPAIFEEVAFRGFLFNNVKQVSSGPSAIYVSGFIFGVMHLQFISLLWLIPIGLAFGFLRNKYDTLWYGVIGHFTYNFCITLFEFKGWF